RPLILVSSLESLACEVEERGALVVACLDARKGEVFVGPYRDRAPVAEERSTRPGDLAALVEAWRGGAPVILIGDALDRFPDLAGLGRWVRRTPAAAQVGRLAWPRLRRGEVAALDAAAPRYVRAPEITESKRRPP